MREETTYRGYLNPELGKVPYYDQYKEQHDDISIDVQELYDRLDLSQATIGTVSSPGALRLRVGQPGDVSFALGQAAPSDGAFGLYYWVVGSATDDGGRFIVPAGTPGGYWRRLMTGSAWHAKWYLASASNPDNGAVLNSMLSYVGAHDVTIVFDHDEDATETVYDVDSNVTLPENVTLRFERGARFNLSAGVTLTTHHVEAPPVLIFDGPGAANVVLASGGYGSANWFPEINHAVNCGMHDVRLEEQVYASTETINVPTAVHFHGLLALDGGTTGTIIRPTSAVHTAILMDGINMSDLARFRVDMTNMSARATYGPVTTISFTSTFDGGVISDSAAGLGAFAEAGTVIGIGGSTGTLNDSTYVVQDGSTAAALTVKGVTITAQAAGASITVTAGPIGIHNLGVKRGEYNHVMVTTDAENHGTALWYTASKEDSASAYYNLFLQCAAKGLGGTKRGVGYLFATEGTRAVTNNDMVISPAQALGIDFLICGSGSGFKIDSCNGENAGQWGIYVSDVPSAGNTAVKVFGGEWHSANAGEPDALFMIESTINGTIGDNVTYTNIGRLHNNYLRADFMVGEEKVYNYDDDDTLYPESTYMRVAGNSGPVTLNETTPIAEGVRGQLLCLVGDDQTNIVSLYNGGTVLLRQGRWYGYRASVLMLYWSNRQTAWIEIARADTTPFTVRTRYNANYAVHQEENELTLSGATTDWVGAIPSGGCKVKSVTGVVTEAITGAGVTGFQVGDTGDPDHWGDITGLSVGTFFDMRNFTSESELFTAVNNVRITAVGGTFTGGKIRVAIFYETSDAPDE